MLEVVDVWAPWCGPCKQMMPVIEDLASEYNVPDSKVNIKKVNADEDQDFVVKYGIRGIPTLLFMKDGEVVDKIVGATTRINIVKLIEQYSV